MGERFMTGIIRAGLMMALLVPCAAAAHAQVIQGTYNPRDDQYRVLGLVRAQAEYERAEAQYQRARELAGKQLIPVQELENARAAFERARVDYLQQSLTVLFASPHITIERALKSRGERGRSLVRLTLRNTTAGGVESARIADLLDDDLLTRLRPDEISDVYVSLKAEPGLAGAIISAPYEHRIPVMRSGEPVSMTFALLRDTDAVVVSVNYAGKIEEKTVYLEKDASANIVMAQSVQFSQEADLGGQATYDLQLERFTDEENVFRLAALGLPRDVRYEFRDPDTGARLSQIRFPEGQSQRSIQLVIFLPQRSADGLSMDVPLPFHALVLDPAADAELTGMLSDGEDTAPRLADLRAGRATMELVPRGVGRIQVRTANLYHEVRRGEAVSMEVDLRNSGSRRLDNVRVQVETPLHWTARVEPEFIAELAVDAEQRIAITLEPPPDVAVGDYEARIRTSSAAADRRVETEDTRIRIHVASATSWWVTGLLVSLLLGLVGGVAVFGGRLARR
jgi:hypothetical protein